MSDADAPPSPAVPRLELGMSSESSFIWQKCKSNNSDGEKTGAKDTRSQLVGVVGGGVVGLTGGWSICQDCTLRFYTDRSNVAYQSVN